ncbi:MAG: hypothetical protein SOY47_11430 [Lachnospiraceae bacterium]|nr:hypothetical protein [Lachnospiraceae bacterium]
MLNSIYKILTREMLIALRDMAWLREQIAYQDYPKGVIFGCRLRIEGRYICIGPGQIKCRDYLFLMGEEERIEYAPTESYISLKFKAGEREEFSGYVRYRTSFFLDTRLEVGEDEVELCRFKLKEGARLRTEYKDFYDIQTEYDTVNLAHATWAAADGNSLSKEVTDFFARQVLACEEAAQEDIQFAYLLLQSKEAVRTDVLTDYLMRKTGQKQKGDFILEEAFYHLEQILDSIRRGKKEERRKGQEQTKGLILWD